MRRSHSRIKDWNAICDSEGFSKIIAVVSAVGFLTSIAVGGCLSKFTPNYPAKPFVNTAIVLGLTLGFVGPIVNFMTDENNELSD